MILVRALRAAGNQGPGPAHRWGGDRLAQV